MNRYYYNTNQNVSKCKNSAIDWVIGMKKEGFLRLLIINLLSRRTCYP